MSDKIETMLRSAGAYDLAKKALSLMEESQVWPTTQNFRIWLEYAGNPNGEIAAEIRRLTESKQFITEFIAEDLAKRFLPTSNSQDSFGDISSQLDGTLQSISTSVELALKHNSHYSLKLSEADSKLGDIYDPASLKDLITGIVAATRQIQEENNTLEAQLRTSTSEVSVLRKRLDQVQHESKFDALTGLANRKAFDDGLKMACAEAAGGAGKPLALAMIDIDHFKRFNDTWGHQTGDQVIRYVASVLGRVGSGVALAARYGGEEFAIIFPNNSLSFVIKELETVRLEISSRRLKRRSTQEELTAVTISMGVAERHKGESASNLIERADAALYQSKINGRNRLTIAAPDLHLGKGAAKVAKAG
jgi:diguanylate cyclase